MERLTFGNDYNYLQKNNFIMKHKLFFIVAFISFFKFSLVAQIDSTSQAEEDFSMYDNLQFADKGSKNFCSNKIEGLSPSKFISLGYDFQGPQTLSTDTFLNQVPSDNQINSVHGLRISANIPVVSSNKLIIQLTGNYIESRYEIDQPDEKLLSKSLSNNGLRTMGLGTTIFKPLNEKQFILFQGSGDLNGDWKWNDLMPLKYLKYSAAALFGVRKTDRKQWGVGLSRTYRAGELNYIPIILFNSTNISNTWGTEILFPARAHVRRTFNARSMAFFGYELEGQSYRLRSNVNYRDKGLEIRRSEVRLRLVYERSIKGFIWLSVQAGYRLNYRYNVDELPDGIDFYRGFGFFDDRPFVMENKLTNPFYFNVSINLVSP